MSDRMLKVTLCACASAVVRTRTASATPNTDTTRLLEHLTPQHTRTSIIEGQR